MISLIAVLVGVLLITQGLLGVLAPEAFVGVVRFFKAPSVIYVAAALRIAIGIVLLCAVTGSRLPIVIGGVLTPVSSLRTSFLLCGPREDPAWCVSLR